ncbi:hypothetical protein EHW62_09140 [Salinivibrio sp. VYel8]|uniref:hypothetical protein n=1 Tax=unclassified Salinivibrio TaxID=2636825 RepID=UPI00128B4008|nr:MULTISPECIES: hypothetical protein [unclassified Salinivibrio]MPY06088.1 hypothetical protein [Salinivibrio sp. VYel8]MPY14173.1 hypothetical protein [Salinivibrio sp. VGrn1]
MTKLKTIFFAATTAALAGCAATPRKYDDESSRALNLARAGGVYDQDLRLRQWLGDEDDLPHGVFQQSNYPRVRYQGTAWMISSLDTEDLRAMTNDAYSKVKLPWLAG